VTVVPATLPAVTSIGVTAMLVPADGVLQLTSIFPFAASVEATTFVGVPGGCTDTVIRWVVVPAPLVAETSMTYVPAATLDEMFNVPDVAELVTKLMPVGSDDRVPSDATVDALDVSPSLAVTVVDPPVP
jgi:hypothetical protein